MTVVVENPTLIVNGNGTKTGYSIDFSLTASGDLKIFYTPKGELERELGTSDYTFTPNANTVGGTIEFVTITPQTTDILRFTRKTPVNQTVDFIGAGTVTPENVEFDMDKIIRILQELDAEFASLPASKIPDPTLQNIGQLIITDGSKGYTFYPLSLSIPAAGDDQKVLLVDWGNKRIKFISAPSIANPVIPQPVSEYKYLVSDSGAYTLTAEHPKPLPGNDGQAEVWDDSTGKYKFVDFPNVPDPTAAQQFLASEPAGAGGFATNWRDYRPAITDLSSGVVSGCVVTKASGTSIDIGAGILQVVSDSAAPPASIELVQYAGQAGIPIDTGTGTTHFVYVETNPTPTVVVETSYTPKARGTKVFLAEVEHTHDQEITKIETSYILVTSLASQFREFVNALVGNVARNVELLPVSVTSGDAPANRQLRYTSGLFVGYGVSSNADQLKPHEKAINASTPASFRWRTSTDFDTAPLSEIDTSTLQIDDGAGGLSPIGVNNFILVPVWLYPDGALILQYPRKQYNIAGAVPDLADYLATFTRSPIAARNAALIAVVQMQGGKDFSDTGDMFITPIAGVSSGGGSGSGSGLPPVTPADEGKILIANNNSSWVLSAFSLPTPSPADEGKGLKVDFSGNFDLADDNDELGRTWLTNGVLGGIKFSFTAGSTTLTISGGTLVFCLDGAVGQPKNVKVLSYAGGDYVLQNPTTQPRTYIEIDENGVVTETASQTTYIRGVKCRLFRVDHAGGTIESVSPIYFDLNCVPEQIKSIFDAYGNVINGMYIQPEGTDVLAHNGGIFHGFNAGAQVDLLSPHKLIISGKDPIPFQFRQTDGTETAVLTAFPAIPKIESPPNTLTDLPVGHVAYFPLWIFPDGTGVFQYSIISWAAGSQPAPEQYLLAFVRDPDLQATASLKGLVEWERGKDFSNDNKFLDIAGGSGGGGGSSGSLLPATPADATKIYTIDETGNTILGVKIEQPIGQKDPQDLANKFLKYNLAGTEIIATAENIPNIGTLAQGSHILAARDGVISTLDNSTEFVDPSLWSTIDQQYYNVEPFGEQISRKGIMVSRGTLNNVTGGQVLRLADMLDQIDQVPWTFANTTEPFGKDKFGKMYVSSGTDYGGTDAYLRFNPVDAGLAAGLTPATGQMKITSTSQVKGAIPVFFWSDDNKTGFTVRSECYLSRLSQNSGFSLANSSSDPIKLTVKGVSEAANFYVASGFDFFTGGYIQDASGRYYVKDSKFLAAFKPKNVGGEINFQVTIKRFLFKEATAGAGFEFRFWTTSSTPIAAQTTRTIDLSTSIPVDPVTGKKVVDLQVTTTFKSTDTVLHHLNSSDVYAVTDDTPAFGFQIYIGNDVGSLPREVTPFFITGGELEIEMRATKGTIIDSRYEYGTLASIDALPENKDPATPINTHVFTGKAPALKAGKILILYYLMYPKSPQKLADYDEDLKGIVLHPFDPVDYPSIFLEDQTGSAPPTSRIEAKKRKGRSTLFEVYEIECTQAQFDNWKVAVYFRFTKDEQLFKTKANSVGASLWFVNEEYVL